MKKLIALLSLCLLPLSVKAGCVWPEFKVSYYKFDSTHLKDIYGSGAALYQGELNYRVRNDLILFVDAGFLSKEGHSLNFRQKTRIQIVPWTLGAKYQMDFNCGSAYFGAGFRTMVLNIHNSSNYVYEQIRKTKLGGMITGGANFCWKGVIFNPFIDYSFNKMNFYQSRGDRIRNISRHSLDLSGWSFGAGIGYLF